MIGAMATQETLRRRLAANLRRQDYLHEDRVAQAFLSVPRHVFVPGEPMKDVYTDRAFVTKVVDGMGVSSSSQPAIMAVMLEQLRVEPGQNVLEIGAGTGYNAALLSHLVGENGRVTTIDIDPETAEGAWDHLRSAGCDGVTVLAADGRLGYPEGALYDRIIATASCWRIPQTWVEQLAEGGILALPLRLNGAQLIVGLRKEKDELVSERVAMGGFMPLRGVHGPRLTHMELSNMRVSADMKLKASTERSLARVLQDGRPVKVAYPRARDATNTPLYYLALQGRPVLVVLRSPESWGDVPFALVGSPTSAIALPWRRPERGLVKLYGDDEALDFLRDALERWRAEGRPDQRDLRARVRPSSARIDPLPRPVNGRYRFRRGDHVYELWFER